MTAAHRPGRAAAGFTLVEVLVALFLMALLATLAWQGLDGILRARDASRIAMDRTVRLSTVLTQWEQDLAALYDGEDVPSLRFDGQTLRLTRRAPGGVMLVAWAVRGGVWQRWAGPVVTRVPELQDSFLRSQQFMGNEAGQLTLATGASDWQVYFNRGGQWTNAQSTGDFAPIVVAVPPPAAAPAAAPAAPTAPTAPTAAGGSVAAPATAAAPPPAAARREVLPEAVRLLITLDGQTLQRDIALGPGGT